MKQFKFFPLVLLIATVFFTGPASAKLENGMSAEVVLGQRDFSSASANAGGSVSAFGFSTPRGIHSDGQHLFFVDASNNRILIWNRIPTSNFTPADVVVGQPDFSSNTANNGGIGPATLSSPVGVFYDGKRLFVADFSNHRILIWSSLPTTNFAPADVVVGQPDFTSSSRNQGSSPTASTLDFPQEMTSDGTRLVVTDTTNNRVLIWNTIPTANNTPADIVLGQPDFVSNTPNNGGRSAKTFQTPAGAAFIGQGLAIADRTNNRILIWKTCPTQNFTPADIVLGQPGFTSGNANNGGRNDNRFSDPANVSSDGRRLFVSDGNNNRVMIYNSPFPPSSSAADFVIGQDNFTSAIATTSERSMRFPRNSVFDGRKLYVADQTNNRILIFNLGEISAIKLGPQFTQGKAVLGKVFEDKNANDWQDSGEQGIAGVKVASDTGIYAITDEDGKYHFPFIEVGQRVLKIDASTLPEGSRIVSESPRKIVVTEGVLTKVSFGVKLPVPEIQETIEEDEEEDKNKDNDLLLKASMSQDAGQLKPRLSVSASWNEEKDKVIFKIDCNYFLFIQRSELLLYDEDFKPLKMIALPNPLPYDYELQKNDLPSPPAVIHYQLVVYDSKGSLDRTSLGQFALPETQTAGPLKS